MSAETIEEIRRQLAAEPAKGLWAQNAEAARAFLTIDTQWRVVAGQKGLVFLGFDYAGVAAGLAAAELETTPSLWGDLRIMEAEARAALNGIRG